MKPITFRPTPDAMNALTLLMNVWDCNRSYAINKALVLAVLDPGLRGSALEERAREIVLPKADKVPLKNAPSKFRQEIKKPEWKK